MIKNEWSEAVNAVGSLLTEVLVNPTILKKKRSLNCAELVAVKLNWPDPLVILAPLCVIKTSLPKVVVLPGDTLLFEGKGVFINSIE